MDFLGLLRTCCNSCTNSPNRLIGDNYLAELFCRKMKDTFFQLLLNKLKVDVLVPFFQCFTDTKDGFQTILQHSVGLLRQQFICFAKILPAL